MSSMSEPREYEAPRLERVGSLSELTQATQYSSIGDGGTVYHPSPSTTLLPTLSR